MKPLVIYHANCIDGSAAAVCAYKYFSSGADFYPATHGAFFDVNLTKDREVYLLDFCFKREVILRIKELCNKLIVLDHHKTALEELEDIKFEGKLDMEHSGAMLSYDYFGPDNIKKEVIERVEDRDLWIFNFDDTKEIAAFLFALTPFNVTNPESVREWTGYLNTPLHVLRQLGYGALKIREANTKLGIERAYRATMAGYNIWIANATDCFSEIAGQLATLAEFGVAYYENAEGKYVYSLRSVNDFDVSEIAKIFGGGGHKNAAGCNSFTKLHTRV